MTSVLLVNHKLSKLCGIYAHGVRMFNILKASKKYKFIYCECSSLDDLAQDIKNYEPKFIIYNYTDGLIGWARNASKNYKDIVHLALGHDVPQSMIDRGRDSDFNFRIALDPTLTERNNWFTTVRPLFNYSKKPLSIYTETPTIGTFGFYFEHKNFEYLVKYCLQTVKCKLNLHITEAHFSSDSTKQNFKRFINFVNELKTKFDINLSTNYVTDEEQINFLSNNDINLFFYSANVGSGPSSAIDYAVASGRPLLINNSYQFRHISSRLPIYPDYDVLKALKLGNSEVLKLQSEWSESNFLKDYERILYEVQNR